ncbi:MAG: hypothetical protein M1457_06420, partial [bacterium]|nr:hypothetical protein [bacterium]
FPGRRWRWIMGSDTLAEAPQWRAFDQVAALAPPLVVPRQGHASPPGAPSGPGDFALPDLSSTFVRELIGRGRWEELRALVPEPVVDWIRQRGLYDDGGA